MTTLRHSIPTFALANPIYIGAHVSFYTVNPTTGAKTTTLATLYAGATGTTTVGNPYTLDGEGKFAAAVFTEVPLIATVQSLHADTHDVGPIQMRGTYRGNWVTATSYFSSDSVRDSATDKVYVVADDYVSGASVAADISASHLVLMVDPVFDPADSNRVAKAWVNFNGTGTPAIRSSYNVASITDGGTGIFSVNFTVPMSDANYCVVVTAGLATKRLRADIVGFASMTTALFTIVVTDESNVVVDPTVVTAVVFGN
jgi:hypothetical protein